MTRLLLMRHGRSEWNAAKRIQGWAESPLDETGREQARRLAGRLKADPPDVLYASPLRRASETCEILAAELDMTVVFDERLKEIGAGQLTGLTNQEVGERFPELVRQWQEDPNGIQFPGEEDREGFRSRVAAVFDEIASRHPEETVGVVSHGGALRAYLNVLLGLPGWTSPFRFGNGSLTIVEINQGRPRITIVNDRCHQEGLE